MSDDRFQEQPPPMRKFKEVAETAFDRAEKAKFEAPATENWCDRCSNSGIEIYKDNGYKVARRCDHGVGRE